MYVSGYHSYCIFSTHGSTQVIVWANEAVVPHATDAGQTAIAGNVLVSETTFGVLLALWLLSLRWLRRVGLGGRRGDKGTRNMRGSVVLRLGWSCS